MPVLVPVMTLAPRWRPERRLVGPAAARLLPHGGAQSRGSVMTEDEMLEELKEFLRDDGNGYWEVVDKEGILLALRWCQVDFAAGTLRALMSVRGRVGAARAA